MEVFISVLAVAVALSCLVALALAGWKDRMRRTVKVRKDAPALRPDNLE